MLEFAHVRPIDARLAVLSTTKLANSAIPETIRTFFSLLLEAPSSTGKAPEPVAPEYITVDEVEYQLENDEDVQVVESKTEVDDVVLRSVRTKDMVLGVDRMNSHSEVGIGSSERENCPLISSWSMSATPCPTDSGESWRRPRGTLTSERQVGRPSRLASLSCKALSRLELSL
jgi:hypothetical protein